METRCLFCGGGCGVENVSPKLPGGKFVLILYFFVLCSMFKLHRAATKKGEARVTTYTSMTVHHVK